MLQGIRETSLLPKYPIGMRFAEGDRVFRYCKADTLLPQPALVNGNAGAANGDFLHFMNSAVAAVAGDTDITVVIDAAEAAYAQNQFRDGYITIHTAPMQVCLKIRGNDVSVGGNVVLHLAEALLFDVPLPTFVEIHENQYNSVIAMNVTHANYESVVVVPIVAVPIYHHFWGQTWGPCLCSAAFGGGIGAVANERSVYFNQEGAIACATDLAPGTGFQFAGYIIPTTWRDGAAADNIHFFLQLAP